MSETPTQLQWKFFEVGEDPPSKDARNAYLDVNNPNSPYFGFIGNRKAIDKLQLIDFTALGKFNRATTELNVALLGRPGCGKTELVRRHNKARQLPLVEISPKSFKTTHEIFLEIKRVCESVNPPLPLVELGRPNNYKLPPLDVFIDEVHAISGLIVQGLLKATEHNDGILVTDRGCTVDCHDVHWIIATTDRGKLFDAFDSRFTKINLSLYNKDEIAKIIQVSHPELDQEACRLVAHYCARVPREAKAFAREMELEHNRNPINWVEIAKKVAENNDIDPFGMTYQRLSILKALSVSPIAEKRLHIVVGVKPEEMEKYILPWLLEQTDDQMPYVKVGHKGYELTESGREELKKRGCT